MLKQRKKQCQEAESHIKLLRLIYERMTLSSNTSWYIVSTVNDIEAHFKRHNIAAPTPTGGQHP